MSWGTERNKQKEKRKRKGVLENSLKTKSKLKKHTNRCQIWTNLCMGSMPLASDMGTKPKVGTLKETKKKERRSTKERKKQNPAKLKGHALHWPKK